MSKKSKYKGIKKAVLNYNHFGHMGITIYVNPKKREVLTNMDKLQLEETDEKDLFEFLNSGKSDIEKLSMKELENLLLEKESDFCCEDIF